MALTEKITSHPDEIERFMQEGLIAITLSGKEHPEGYVLHGEVNSNTLYELQKMGYLSVIQDTKKNITRARLTERGFEFYKRMVQSLDKNIMSYFLIPTLPSKNHPVPSE